MIFDAVSAAVKAVDQYAQRYDKPPELLYGVPRGGIPVAYLVAQQLDKHYRYSPLILDRDDLVVAPSHALSEYLVVDDIYDSGRTLAPYLSQGLNCLVLAVRSDPHIENLDYGVDLRGNQDWVVFPWEYSAGHAKSGPEDAVVRLLQWLKLDPNKPSLQDTPRRVVEWLRGFADNQELGSAITTFDGEVYDEMVLVRDVPFVALCEHHLLPFVGRAAVAYIPQPANAPPLPSLTPGREEYIGGVQSTVPAKITALRGAVEARGGPIVGLSKLARIVQWRAKRPTVQERLTEEIRAEVEAATGSENVAVILTAEHFCMTLRGANAVGSKTVTSALSGAFKTNETTRAEFLNLTR